MLVVDAVVAGQLLTSTLLLRKLRVKYGAGRRGEKVSETDWTERVWGIGPRPFRGRFYLILM